MEQAPHLSNKEHGDFVDEVPRRVIDFVSMSDKTKVPASDSLKRLEEEVDRRLGNLVKLNPLLVEFAR